jgi:hypothetical protein
LVTRAEIARVEKTWETEGLDEIFPRCDGEASRLRFQQGGTVEYTDAPALEPPVSADTMACPLCGHVLPKDADACDRCDWVRTETETAEGKASDAVAVMLSVIPGLGHVYKGHKMLGLLFVIGAFGAILLGGLAATATAGFGLALIPIYWFAVMFHVYGIEDRVATTVKDEGEEY